VLGGDPGLAPDGDYRDAVLADQAAHGLCADLELVGDLLHSKKIEAIRG
jgi:hypothetical protein